MTSKLNIIFDLDETLISTLLVRFGNGERRNINMTENVNIGIINIENKSNITFIRPYLDELLEYCYEHFNVSFWTAGGFIYCQEVLKIILTEEQYNKTKVIFSKYNDNTIIEIKSNAFITNNNLEKINCKSLDILYYEGSEFNPNNTIIIDDKLNVCNYNKKNAININPYNRLNKYDQSLKKLLEWFKNGNFFLTNEKKLKYF